MVFFIEKLTRPTVLNNEEILKIHENSLKVLEDTGMYIDNDEVLKTCLDMGLNAELNKKIVKFPRDVVEKSLQSIPKEIKLYNRSGDLATELGRVKGNFTSGHNAIYVYDYDTNERRNATKDDVGKFAVLSDYHPDIDIVGIQAMPQDVKAESSLVHAVDAVFNNTEKHIFFSPERAEVADAIFNIAEVATDSSDLGGRSPLTCQLSPTSPLTWEKGAIEALSSTVKKGVPLCLLPQPFTGVTSPYTLAGHITIHNAETLSGIVFSQLINPGSAVIYGSAWSTFDMRTANVLIGSPETVLLRIAGSQMAEFYHIPYHTIAPDTDAHIMDEQLAWEKFATTWGAYLADSDLIVNGGLYSTGLTVSFEQLILDSEMVSYIKRLFRGIKVDDDTLAQDVIEKLGPRGNYLADEHTLMHLGQGEHWEPMVSTREIYENWKTKGMKDIVHKAHEKATSIMENHRVSELSDNKRKEIVKIIDNFESSI
ncbi:MAG: trimethylamine methyltransferase family protein [Spirochaetota bacterium]|nr:MAG: trimethylamine methyltransferase family protein [Spirochaetota bacterium]